MNSKHLKEITLFRRTSVLLTGKKAVNGVVYDLYHVAEKTSGSSANSTPRASAMVIRQMGKLPLNGSMRHVTAGDILIVPPAAEPTETHVFDIWTLAAAGLILLATARLFL